MFLPRKQYTTKVDRTCKQYPSSSWSLGLHDTTHRMLQTLWVDSFQLCTRRETLFLQKIKFKITILTTPLLKKGITELS